MYRENGMESSLIVTSSEDKADEPIVEIKASSLN